MCIYITTRHVCPNGSAQTQSSEWVLCANSTGYRPCPDQGRREQIVQAESVGSPGSTISSNGPATPVSAASDRRRRSTYGRARMTSGSPLQHEDVGEPWSPINGEEVIVETRRPHKSLSRQNRRYRVSIDTNLGPLLPDKPIVSQPNSPSTTTDESSIPVRLRQAFPASRSPNVDCDAGPSHRSRQEVQNRHSEQDEARQRFRREDGEREKSARKKPALEEKMTETLKSSGSAMVELTHSQELKEREEQMWDDYELRTAQRMSYREQLREDTRRRREEEGPQEEQKPSKDTGPYQVHEIEDVEELTMTRQLAEVAVESGARQRETLEAAQLHTQKAVLEKKLALSRMMQCADEDDQASHVRQADEEDQERARLLRFQIQEGRQRESELQGERDQRPTFDRLKDFAHGRSKKGRVDREIRAKDLRIRIQEYEQHLKKLEVQIRERHRAEQARQQKIVQLEEYIEALNRRIEAREWRASMMTRRTEYPGSSDRRAPTAANDWRGTFENPQTTPLLDSAYLRSRGERVLERDRRSARYWEADEAAAQNVRLSEVPLRRRDTIGGQHRAREKAYRDPRRTG